MADVTTNAPRPVSAAAELVAYALDTESLHSCLRSAAHEYRICPSWRVLRRRRLLRRLEWLQIATAARDAGYSEGFRDGKHWHPHAVRAAQAIGG
jgi:hypothetical protein